MSTNFDVLPTIKTIPLFSDVLNLSNTRLRKYACLYNIDTNKNIKVKLVKYENNETIVVNENELAQWELDKFAFFYIDKYRGGIEAQFSCVNDLLREVWIDEVELKQPSNKIRDLIFTGFKTGYHWSFKKIRKYIYILRSYKWNYSW